jgi:parallel beta-helix repeat protein
MRRFVALAATFALSFIAVPAQAAHAASCVQMTSGQPDINTHAAGTSFCLSGTHNWTLHPKTKDVITGDSTAVLDGQHSTDFAIISDPNVSNVVLYNFEIRNYTVGGGDFRGAITAQDSSAATWWLVQLRVHDIGIAGQGGAGAELGTNWHVVGGRYYNNRQEGLTNGNADGFSVRGAELDHNNFADDTYRTASVSCQHEAGGMKWVADNVTVANSYVHDNACRGLWADINSNNATITGNRVANNWDEGIFWEVSLGASITHNVVTGNGFKASSNTNGPGCGAGWGGGISVSDSGNNGNGQQGTIDISHNDIEANCNAYTGLDNGATGGACGNECEVANVHVHDNKIVGSTNPLANNNFGNFEWDGDGDVASSNNTFANNTISGNVNFCGNGC